MGGIRVRRLTLATPPEPLDPPLEPMPRTAKQEFDRYKPSSLEDEEEFFGGTRAALWSCTMKADSELVDHFRKRVPTYSPTVVGAQSTYLCSWFGEVDINSWDKSAKESNILPRVILRFSKPIDLKFANTYFRMLGGEGGVGDVVTSDLTLGRYRPEDSIAVWELGQRRDTFLRSPSAADRCDNKTLRPTEWDMLAPATRYSLGSLWKAGGRRRGMAVGAGHYFTLYCPSTNSVWNLYSSTHGLQLAINGRGEAPAPGQDPRVTERWLDLSSPAGVSSGRGKRPTAGIVQGVVEDPGLLDKVRQVRAELELAASAPAFASGRKRVADVEGGSSRKRARTTRGDSVSSTLQNTIQSRHASDVEEDELE